MATRRYYSERLVKTLFIVIFNLAWIIFALLTWPYVATYMGWEK